MAQLFERLNSRRIMIIERRPPRYPRRGRPAS